MKKLINFFAYAAMAASVLAFTGCNNDDDDNGGGTPKPGEGEVITVTDDGSGTGTVTWTADNTYLLDGFVYVNSGQTLTIEPGTVIKGRPGQGDQASALVVARGGKIMANGTAEAPIIMTAEQDNLDGNLGTTSGLWGGLIVLGNARLNSAPGETAIEGIPTSETRGLYGGNDDNDNSGVIKYVSIRHGGTDIGAGNEINGFSLGGVGSGTTIDYVEVFANKDDGIEWYGGTAQAKHLVVGFCGDDALDYDEGYRGHNQYVFVYQEQGSGDRGGEHDGGTSPEDGQPYAKPTFYNVTSIGGGNANSNRAITMRDNAGGYYFNSIFFDYGRGVDIELLASGESSYRRFEASELAFQSNAFFNVADGTAAGIFNVSTGDGVAEDAAAAAEAFFERSFDVGGNKVMDLGVSRTNFIPSSTLGSSTTPNSSFIEIAEYQGAFAPGGSSWMEGWTATSAAL